MLKKQDLTGITYSKDKSRTQLQLPIDGTDHFQNVF